MSILHILIKKNKKKIIFIPVYWLNCPIFAAIWTTFRMFMFPLCNIAASPSPASILNFHTILVIKMHTFGVSCLLIYVGTYLGVILKHNVITCHCVHSENLHPYWAHCLQYHRNVTGAKCNIILSSQRMTEYASFITDFELVWTMSNRLTSTCNAISNKAGFTITPWATCVRT